MSRYFFAPSLHNEVLRKLDLLPVRFLEVPFFILKTVRFFRRQ
jgi:hypothetical protein